MSIAAQGPGKYHVSFPKFKKIKKGVKPMLKIGDFVQVLTGIGCPPKFGYIRGEGLATKLEIPCWIIQTSHKKNEAILKDGPFGPGAWKFPKED